MMMKKSSKKSKGVSRRDLRRCPQTLPRELREKLITLGEEIHTLTEAGRFDEAERLCRSGSELIPEPRDAYIDSAWYLSALGDIYFMRGQFLPAREHCEKARVILEKSGESDPFIMLRLGEIAVETGDEAAALRYLLDAYKTEGAEIFDGRDGKYFDFLKKRADINEE